MTHIGEAAGGLLLIALVLSDVFRTVLVPRATRRRLGIGPLLGSLLIGPLRRAARHNLAPKMYELLGLLGPFLLVASAMAWFLLLILGFSLLMHASRSSFEPPVGLMGALYASASSFLTLGITDHAARSAWTRGLVVGAGLSGFATVPLVITFLLNVQGALTQREQLVLRLGERDGAPPTGPAILIWLERAGGGRQDATERFLEDWDRWFADLVLTHGAFPVLAYFRSADRERDWLVALGAVLDATALLTVLGSDRVPALASDCHRMGCRLAHQLATMFCGGADRDDGDSSGDFDRMLDSLARGGLRAQDCDRARGQRELFERLRGMHALDVAALRRHFGIGQPI